MIAVAVKAGFTGVMIEKSNNSDQEYMRILKEASRLSH
jgi:hypothetical protein